MSKPPCAWLIFRADTLISMVTKFTLWQCKKEIKSDEDHQKKTTTTTIQSHPSTSAQNACFFGRKTYIIGETMGMCLLFFFKFLVGNIWVKSH